GGRAVEERAAERELLHLGVDFLRVVARLRAEHDAAAGPQGRADGTGAGAAGALLAPRLLAAAADFAARLGRVRALAVVGVDGDDHFLHGLEAAVTFEGGNVGE